MAEAIATALVAGSVAPPPRPRSRALQPVDRRERTARERHFANDPELRPHLTDAEIDRLIDPALYLGSAGAFVDRVVARVGALASGAPHQEASMASDAPHDPPFRADHVGSLLRPAELLKARADRAAGKISVEELRAIEDASIREVVAFQESVGLQSITDGEYRREIFYSDFYFRGLGGGTVAYDPSSIDEVYFIDREGHKLPLLVPRVQARMRWHAPIHVDDFKFLRAATSERRRSRFHRRPSFTSAPAARISARMLIPTSIFSGTISSMRSTGN